MNKETEIKLRISADSIDALRNHPALSKHNKTGWQQHLLSNHYFDTPDRALNAARVALRIRQDDTFFIQTLKSRGQSVAGLSTRNEWEWPLTSAELDLSLLDDSCWPDTLKELDKTQLKPAFSTHFKREKAELSWGRGKAKVVIEAAIDQGEAKAGDATQTICELELELKQGPEEALLALACEIASTIAVLPSDISKAEHGYRLLNKESSPNNIAAPALNAEQPLDEAFAAVAQHLLASSQQMLEQYLLSQHWRALVDWYNQVVEMRALIASLGQAAPRASSRELRELLDRLQNSFGPLISAGHTDESARQTACELMHHELSQPQLGLLYLKMAQWLQLKSWAQNRNARGNRQGQAPLANWLLHMLHEETQALQLPRYIRQAEDLADQLPRFERLLVWLRLARNLLEVAEIDRLYGELRKLYELAQGPIDSETLTVRSSQAQIVWTLKAFKQLSR